LGSTKDKILNVITVAFPAPRLKGKKEILKVYAYKKRKIIYRKERFKDLGPTHTRPQPRGYKVEGRGK
jgi:hypothetical protein